jgi:hypothetical protein
MKYPPWSEVRNAPDGRRKPAAKTLKMQRAQNPTVLVGHGAPVKEQLPQRHTANPADCGTKAHRDDNAMNPGNGAQAGTETVQNEKRRRAVNPAALSRYGGEGGI